MSPKRKKILVEHGSQSCVVWWLGKSICCHMRELDSSNFRRKKIETRNEKHVSTESSSWRKSSTQSRVSKFATSSCSLSSNYWSSRISSTVREWDKTHCRRWSWFRNCRIACISTDYFRDRACDSRCEERVLCIKIRMWAATKSSLIAVRSDLEQLQYSHSAALIEKERFRQESELHSEQMENILIRSKTVIEICMMKDSDTFSCRSSISRWRTSRSSSVTRLTKIYRTSPKESRNSSRTTRWSILDLSFKSSSKRTMVWELTWRMKYDKKKYTYLQQDGHNKLQHPPMTYFGPEVKNERHRAHQIGRTLRAIHQCFSQSPTSRSVQGLSDKYREEEGSEWNFPSHRIKLSMSGHKQKTINLRGKRQKSWNSPLVPLSASFVIRKMRFRRKVSSNVRKSQQPMKWILQSRKSDLFLIDLHINHREDNYRLCDIEFQDLWGITEIINRDFKKARYSRGGQRSGTSRAHVDGTSDRVHDLLVLQDQRRSRNRLESQRILWDETLLTMTYLPKTTFWNASTSGRVNSQDGYRDPWHFTYRFMYQEMKSEVAPNCNRWWTREGKNHIDQRELSARKRRSSKIPSRDKDDTKQTVYHQWISKDPWSCKKTCSSSMTIRIKQNEKESVNKKKEKENVIEVVSVRSVLNSPKREQKSLRKEDKSQYYKYEADRCDKDKNYEFGHPLPYVFFFKRDQRSEDSNCTFSYLYNTYSTKESYEGICEDENQKRKIPIRLSWLVSLQKRRDPQRRFRSPRIDW